MNYEIKQEIELLGGDATDPLWDWLVRGGPHGESFTWSQTKSEPAGYVGVVHLEKIIAEAIDKNASFIKKAKEIVQLGLESKNIIILIKSIQIGAVVGSEKELEIIRTLVKSENSLVSKNAKAANFYLKKRLKFLAE